MDDERPGICQSTNFLLKSATTLRASTDDEIQRRPRTPAALGSAAMPTRPANEKQAQSVRGFDKPRIAPRVRENPTGSAWPTARVHLVCHGTIPVHVRHTPRPDLPDFMHQELSSVFLNAQNSRTLHTQLMLARLSVTTMLRRLPDDARVPSPSSSVFLQAGLELQGHRLASSMAFLIMKGIRRLFDSASR